MSETLLKNVQEMLNEEKWTRATLSNYSTNQFKELDTILKESREDRSDSELKKLCDEHLVHTKNSIIALYLGGMTALSQQIIDDSAMVNLVTIFVDNHKWGIVKYLCERMLDYGESKFALRTLADCCKNENDEESIFGIWERLVRVDYEEADIAKALADHFEKLGDPDNAIDYYKKALHRYIAKQLFSNVKEIWDKLLYSYPKEIDFFLHVQKRVAKNFDELKAGALLKDVYAACARQNDINTAISVLKLILEYDNDDRQARKDITDCYRKKYADHSQLEAYIRISSLAQGPRNVKEAVQDFEKHIAFDRGNFVFHRTWGVGRIAGVQGDEIVIDFAKQRGHSMSLKMAVNALQTLSKEHIWVLKATWKKEKLHEKIKYDFSSEKPALEKKSRDELLAYAGEAGIAVSGEAKKPEILSAIGAAKEKEAMVWAIKTVIRSFGNSCDIKRIKAELVPSVLTASEWTGWSSKAREILKTDPSFGLSPDNADLYSVRERPISLEEKLYNEFKAAKNFFERAQTIRNYASQKDAEIDSDYFAEMFSYFTGYLKSYSQVNEQVVASYLLVKDLVAMYPYLGTGIKINFADLYGAIGDTVELFQNLKDPRLKEEFLKHIQLYIPGWADIFIKIFPRNPTNSIILNLRREGYEEMLSALVSSCFDNYRDCRESVVWLFRNSNREEWFRKAGIPYEKQLITLIHILDICYREIDNRRDTADNRKLSKMVSTILFKEDVINDFIDTSDPETIIRIFTFINDVKDLDPTDKMVLKNRIVKMYPDFKFFGDEERKAAPIGLMVTDEKRREKIRELTRIQDVELPEISRAIDDARMHGDLSENYEYKSAKEKQSQLQAEQDKLKSDLDRAQVFDPSTVNASRVSFGTHVTLLDRNSGNKEEYTILGPWESAPENGIISYLSPKGAAIMNKKAGEDVDFSINNEEFSYRVEEISPAKF